MKIKPLFMSDFTLYLPELYHILNPIRKRNYSLRTKIRLKNIFIVETMCMYVQKLRTQKNLILKNTHYKHTLNRR